MASCESGGHPLFFENIEGGNELKIFSRANKPTSLCAALCAAAVILAARPSPALSGEADFRVNSYQALHTLLSRLNPGGSHYESYKDENVAIRIENDLSVFDLGSALASPTDADTGATLAISRPNVTIDGNGHTIMSYGYPAFHVEGNAGDDDPFMGGIAIKDLVIDGAGYQAKVGGGLFFENKAEIEMNGVTVKNGSAKMGGGGALYAGPHHSSSGPKVTIRNCAFEGNKTASGAGGAILGYFAQIAVSGTTFDGNSAPLGGAIAIYGNGARLAATGRNSFKNNDAVHSGGAVHVFYASHRAAGRGNPIIETTDISASLDGAEFRGNAAGVAGTEDCVFSVFRDPAETGEETSVASRLSVDGSPVRPTFFSDSDRTDMRK
jgi:hypothetical protein